jgi:hypothetical protein
MVTLQITLIMDDGFREPETRQRVTTLVLQWPYNSHSISSPHGSLVGKGQLTTKGRFQINLTILYIYIYYNTSEMGLVCVA